MHRIQLFSKSKLVYNVIPFSLTNRSRLVHHLHIIWHVQICSTPNGIQALYTHCSLKQQWTLSCLALIMPMSTSKMYVHFQMIDKVTSGCLITPSAYCAIDKISTRLTVLTIIGLYLKGYCHGKLDIITFKAH